MAQQRGIAPTKLQARLHPSQPSEQAMSPGQAVWSDVREAMTTKNLKLFLTAFLQPRAGAFEAYGIQYIRAIPALVWEMDQQVLSTFQILTALTLALYCSLLCWHSLQYSEISSNLL